MRFRASTAAGAAPETSAIAAPPVGGVFPEVEEELPGVVAEEALGVVEAVEEVEAGGGGKNQFQVSSFAFRVNSEPET